MHAFGFLSASLRFFGVAVLVLLVRSSPAVAADERVPIETITARYHDFVRHTRPGLSADVVARLTELTIPNLTERLGVRLFNVEWQVGRYPHPEDPVLWYDGRVWPFTNAFGGWGPMSAVLVGDVLYYTYSWGSGIHRSVVGRLMIHDGTPTLQDALVRQSEDMFVKPLPDGRVAVVGGKFDAFNRWHDEVALGCIVDNPVDGFRVAPGLRLEPPEPRQ